MFLKKGIPAVYEAKIPFKSCVYKPNAILISLASVENKAKLVTRKNKTEEVKEAVMTFLTLYFLSIKPETKKIKT